jgi:hypothetical protein
VNFSEDVTNLFLCATIEPVMLKIGGRKRPDHLSTLVSTLACGGKFSAMQ